MRHSLTVIFFLAAFAIASTAAAGASVDQYKKCPACKLEIPRIESDSTIEINFCVSCGADLKAIALATKSEPEKIREMIKKRRRELGDPRQLRAMEWYERSETAEDRIYRISCLINASELEPKSEKFLNNLGVLYDERGLTDEAISCFRKAVEAAPGYSPAINNLAKCLSDIGKYDDAGEYYLKAVQLDDKNPVVRKNHADLLVKMKKYDEALGEYRTAVTLDPDGQAGRIAAWRIDLVNRRFKNAGTAKQPAAAESPRPPENAASTEIRINDRKMIENQ